MTASAPEGDSPPIFPNPESTRFRAKTPPETSGFAATGPPTAPALEATGPGSRVRVIRLGVQGEGVVGRGGQAAGKGMESDLRCPPLICRELVESSGHTLSYLSTDVKIESTSVGIANGQSIVSACVSSFTAAGIFPQPV